MRVLEVERLHGSRAGVLAGPTDPFVPWSVDNRATNAWKKAKLPRLTLHEARHTFASLLIAAGVKVKAISTYMGHASVTITLDRYGHLLPGHAAEAVAKIDSYLAESGGRS